MQIPSNFGRRVLCCTTLDFFGNHRRLQCSTPHTVSAAMSWQWPKYTFTLSLILA